MPSARQQRWLKAVKANPNDFAAWLALAAAQLGDGDAPSAIESLQRVMKSRPGDPMAQHLLGFAYETAGDPGRALEAWKKAAKGWPRSSQAWEHVALLADRLSKGRVALQARRELAKLHAGDAEWLADIGTALSRQGHHDDALSLFEAVERLKPGFLAKNSAEQEAWRESRQAAP